MRNQKIQPTFECLEERVLLSGAPYDFPIVSRVPFSYDVSGETITCMLRGAGSGTWETDAEGDLFIELNGTDSKSYLQIKGEADIEKLDVNGSLRKLDAKYSDIEKGTGKVNITGILKDLKLDDILEGSEVIFNKGNPIPDKTYAKITIDELNGSLEAGLPVRSVKLGSIGNNGVFDVLGFVKTISVKGDVEGLYKSRGYTKSFSVRGNVIGADISSGEIYKFSVRGNVSNSEINTKNGFKQGRLNIRGNIEDSLIGAFYQYSIGSNLVNSNVETGVYTRNFSVKGSVIDSLIKSKEGLEGTFEKLNVKGDFRNSGLYVLYSPGGDNIYGGYDDSLIEREALKPLIVTIKGIYENSWIGTSKTLKYAKLNYVKTDNNDMLFGLFCYDAGKIKIGRQNYEPGKFGDFTVEYIKEIPEPGPTPPDPFS